MSKQKYVPFVAWLFSTGPSFTPKSTLDTFIARYGQPSVKVRPATKEETLKASKRYYKIFEK